MPTRKILAINGSYRGDKGYTHYLLEKIFQGAGAAGAECEEIALSKHKINRCLACDECHTSHPLECAYAERDDVAGLFEKMRTADLLIYAAPIYIFGISGLMKVFLDRMNSTARTHDFRITKSGLFFHHINADLCSKPFAVLTCCDSLDAEMPRSTLAYFRAYARFMDAPWVGTLVRNAGVLSAYGKDAPDVRMQSRLTRIYEAYEEAGKELASIGRIRPSTQRLANQEIIPIPLFGLFKRLVPFKHVMVERAKEMLPS
jgi:multimeric flavodoxin WrbA